MIRRLKTTEWDAANNHLLGPLLKLRRLGQPITHERWHWHLPVPRGCGLLMPCGLGWAMKVCRLRVTISHHRFSIHSVCLITDNSPCCKCDTAAIESCAQISSRSYDLLVHARGTIRVERQNCLHNSTGASKPYQQSSDHYADNMAVHQLTSWRFSSSLLTLRSTNEACSSYGAQVGMNAKFAGNKDPTLVSIKAQLEIPLARCHNLSMRLRYSLGIAI